MISTPNHTRIVAWNWKPLSRIKPLVAILCLFKHGSILVNHIYHFTLCSFLDKGFIMPLWTLVWILITVWTCIYVIRGFFLMICIVKICILGMSSNWNEILGWPYTLNFGYNVCFWGCHLYLSTWESFVPFYNGLGNIDKPFICLPW